MNDAKSKQKLLIAAIASDLCAVMVIWELIDALTAAVVLSGRITAMSGHTVRWTT